MKNHLGYYIFNTVNFYPIPSEKTCPKKCSVYLILIQRPAAMEADQGVFEGFNVIWSDLTGGGGAAQTDLRSDEELHSQEPDEGKRGLFFPRQS